MANRTRRAKKMGEEQGTSELLLVEVVDVDVERKSLVH